MKVVAIVQTRMGSTRLPGKVLKEISDKPMVWHMFDRLRFSNRLDEIVLAIPDSVQNNILEEFAEEFGFLCYRGSEEDCLSRYYEAAVKFNADVVVRVTSDCPLIDPRVTDGVIEEHLNSEVDYTANNIKRTFPRGLDTEVFNFGAFEKVYREAKQDYEHEHITPYFYQHPEIFVLKSIEASGILRRPDLRLTVDTEEDLKLMRGIFKHLYRDGQLFYTEEVIELLDKCPELIAINAFIKQKELGE